MGLSITGNATGFSGGTVAAAVVIDDDSAAALAVGPNGNTNPALRVVGSVASAATGLSVTGNAAGSGVTLTALSSGTNEDITVAPKGSGSFRTTTIFATGSINADGGLRPGGVNNSLLTSVNSGTVTISNNGGLGGTIAAAAATPAQITADQNNYTPASPSLFMRFSSDASRTLTGLTFAATKQDGQIHYIWNVGSNNLVLAHESASSTAANRFLTSTGADLTVAANKCALLQYDSTISRWRAVLLP